MYLKFVVALLFVVSLTFTAATNCESPICTKPGEVFVTCGTCDGSCDNPNPICTQQCRQGCFCNRGLVRDSSGSCIPPEKCCKSAYPVS